jgi:predicted signal transduction protein with EAL and GGDEF domain
MASGNERGGHGERFTAFLRSASADRVIRLSTAVALASLWLTVALGDPSFLIILVATVPAVLWWRRRRDRAGDELL